MQVRLQAAIIYVGIAPAAARKLIEAISQSGWQPQAGDAGMVLGVSTVVIPSRIKGNGSNEPRGGSHEPSRATPNLGLRESI